MSFSPSYQQKENLPRHYEKQSQAFTAPSEKIYLQKTEKQSTLYSESYVLDKQAQLSCIRRCKEAS